VIGGGEINFVDDRGMIKGPQVTALHQKGLHFITAITKSQIETLLTQGVLQMTLFDAPLAEVEPRGATLYSTAAIRRAPRKSPRRGTPNIKPSATPRSRPIGIWRHIRANPSVHLKGLKNRAQKLRIHG
jgi:hypothetical protein